MFVIYNRIKREREKNQFFYFRAACIARVYFSYSRAPRNSHPTPTTTGGSVPCPPRSARYASDEADGPPKSESHICTYKIAPVCGTRAIRRNVAVVVVVGITRKPREVFLFRFRVRTPQPRKCIPVESATKMRDFYCPVARVRHAVVFVLLSRRNGARAPFAAGQDAKAQEIAVRR